MFKSSLVTFALSFSLAAVACGGAGADSESSASNTDQAVSARAQVKGSWIAEDGTDTGLDLRPDGSFFRDTARVLNGVFVNGARPWKRDTGTYSVSGTHETLTLHVDDGSTEVYAYEYTAAPVLNGIFLPGQGPHAELTLTLQPAPGSHIAFLPQHFKGADSWCNADQDCVDELSDGTWQPYYLDSSNPPQCDVSSNACVNRVSQP